MRLGALTLLVVLSLSNAHGDSWWDRARDAYTKAGYPADSAIEKGSVWRGLCYRNTGKDDGVQTLIHFRRVPGRDAVNLVVIDDGKDYKEMRAETVRTIVRQHNANYLLKYSDLSKGGVARQGTVNFNQRVQARNFEWGINGRGYLVAFPGVYVGPTSVNSVSTFRYSLKAVSLENGQIGFRMSRQATVMRAGDRYLQTFHPNDNRPPISSQAADTYVDAGIDDYCLLDTRVTAEDTEVEGTPSGGTWWAHAVEQWNNQTTWISSIDANLNESIWTHGFCVYDRAPDTLERNVALFLFEDTAPGLGSRRSVAPLYALDYSEMRLTEIRRVFERDIRPRWSYSGYANFTQHFNLTGTAPQNDTQREQLWLKGARTAGQAGWSSLWIGRRAAGQTATKELCKYSKRREEK